MNSSAGGAWRSETCGFTINLHKVSSKLCRFYRRADSHRSPREMASGNWSISKLVSYLVSVKDSLTVAEHQKLGQTRVFLGVSSEHSSDGTRRYLARELYEPSDISRSLGLPMLDWQDAKWHSSSKEGKSWTARHHFRLKVVCLVAKFLFGLGLQDVCPSFVE